MSQGTSDMRMTMSARYLFAQLDILAKLGFTHEQSYAASQLNEDSLSKATTRIPVDRVLPIFEAAEKHLNDPLIGLQVGFRFRTGRYAQTGAIYGYCENLLQVIEMNQRYQRLAIDIAKINYVISHDADDVERHCMHFMTYYEDHKRYRHITDLVMGAYGTTYRWLSWGSGEEIKAVHLPYAAPEDISLYEKVFQCPAHFERPTGALEYNSTTMTQPLTTHDPEKLARAIAQLDQVLGAANSQLSLKFAIEAAMRAALKKGAISGPILAGRLNRPERQLRADMKSAGLSYRKILDEVRQNVFLERYRKGESFASIAQSLAYNDQAAFTRAFRRWYGVPPGQWSDENDR